MPTSRDETNKEDATEELAKLLYMTIQTLKVPTLFQRMVDFFNVPKAPYKTQLVLFWGEDGHISEGAFNYMSNLGDKQELLAAMKAWIAREEGRLHKSEKDTVQ